MSLSNSETVLDTSYIKDLLCEGDKCRGVVKFPVYKTERGDSTNETIIKLIQDGSSMNVKNIKE